MKRNVKLIVIFVISAILLSTLYQHRNLLTFGRKVNRGGENIIYTFESNLTKNYEIYGKNLIINDSNQTLAINQSGKELWNINTLCKNSMLAVSGNYVLVADIGGRDYWIIKNGKLLLQKTLNGEIFTASINEKGAVAVATNFSGYAAHLQCFNLKGEEIYSWKISSEYVIDAKISDDSRSLAVSMLGHEEEKIVNTISFINLSSGKNVSSSSFYDIIYSSLEYNSNGNLLAIGDSSCTSFDKSGKNRWTIDYDGRILQTYAFQRGKNLALFFKNSQNNSNIECYNLNSGKLVNSSSLDFLVKVAEYNRGVIGASGDTNIALISQNAKLKTSLTMNVNVRWQELMKNKKKFYIISNSNVEIVNP